MKKKDPAVRNKDELIEPGNGDIFDRVVSILEQARTNVVRAVNSQMVIAYWWIGREIVQELQGGDERAEYGKKLVKALSVKLTGKYGKGFSTTNLWYFRQFYLVFSDRLPEIRHKPCGESGSDEKLHKACGVLEDVSLAVENSEAIQGFSPVLSWSHYRTLIKVEHKNETIAKYSVLNNGRQLFASKYMLYLPTEDELAQEIERERRLIEKRLDTGGKA